MKTLSIARKTLLELWREPLLLGVLLLFPVAMVGFYYFAFGDTEEGLATYLRVLVINQDAGAATADGTHWQAGEDLVEIIRGTEWEGDPVFDLEPAADRRTAEIALRERKAALLLTIPPDFTQRLLATAQGGSAATPAAVILTGDPGSGNYTFAYTYLNGLVREFANHVADWQQETLTLTYEFLPGTGTMSDFDFGVTGIIIFGIMFISFTTATVMVRENVAGTLQRLRLTAVGAAALLLGVSLAQMAAAAVQVPITFGAAVAFGFRSNGSLLLAMVIGLLLTLTAVGAGLVVACFARNDGEAANLTGGIMVPLVFLSDAMYPMPYAPLFAVAGRTIQIYDFLPTSHGAEALRRVLIFGEGLEAITFELAAMTILSALMLAAGVVLYHQMRMRRAST